MFENLTIKAPYVSTNRGFIKPVKYLKDLMEEDKNTKELPGPLGTQLELTYRCNQRCLHCYNNSASNDAAYSDMLTLDEWKNVCHKLVEAGVVQVIISGGEPFVFGDGVFELMDILHAGGVKFVVISNGMLVNEERVNKLKKYHYDWFQISIDGASPETHNKMRGADAWELAVNATHLLKKAQIPFAVAHAVTKINYHELEEMVNLAYQLGAKKLVISPYEVVGRAILNNDELKLSDEEFIQVYKDLKVKASEFSGRMEISVPPESVVSVHAHKYQKNSVFLIRPNGDIKFDCMSPFKLGNVRKDELQTIWELLGKGIYTNPRVLDYMEQIKTNADFMNVHPRINIDSDELIQKAVM